MKDQQGSLSGSKQTQGSYSLHGLAASQSQTPKESTLSRKESQKENTPTPAWLRPGVRHSHPPAVPIQAHVAPPTPPLDEDVRMEEKAAGPSNARDRSSSSSNEAAVVATDAPHGNFPLASLHDNTAFASGAQGLAKTLPPRSNNSLKRPRSPAPVSQDSSFMALPKDILEKKYVKESRTFQMPLSELGRTQDSSVTEEPRFDNEEDESPSSASGVSWARTQFRDLSVSRTGSQPPSQPLDSQEQRGSSPSYSGSYPQAQRQDDDDYDDFFPTNKATRASSSPQLLAYNQLDIESEPELSTGADTQLTDTVSAVATQPLENDPPVPPIDAYHQSGATSTTSGPRSLLATVNPNKRWRFQGNTAALAQAQMLYKQAQTLYESQEPVAGPSTYEATQPSEVSNLPGTGRLVDSHEEEESGRHYVEETQPSEASNLPDTGHLLDDSRSEHETYDDSGATQPTSASNLPATGLEVDPSLSARTSQPDLLETSEVPETEPSQLVAAPTSSPEVPLAASLVVMRTAERRQAVEEEGDQSQDVPLAVTAKQLKPPSVPLPREDSGSLMPPPRKRARMDPSPAKRSLISAPAPSVRSEDMIIPSSDPQERQDMLATSSGFITTTRGKGKKGTPAPITPVHSKDQDHDDSDAPTERDEVLTELADEEAEERTHSMRKRKRVTSSALKSSTRSIRTNVSTPPTRSTSRMKSVSLARGMSVFATRVLALWKQDSHYYVGTVYSEDNSGQKYVVRFDDGTEDAVDLSKLRRCELRKGDYILVKAPSRPQKAEVVDASLSNSSERKVLVRLDDDFEEEVETKDIMIPSRSIVSSKWNDRTLTADEVVTLLRPKLKQSPTPSKLAEIGSWSKSTKKIFAKTGFVLTTAPGFADWDKKRESLEAQIRSHGGHNFDDWCRVFSMDGKVSNGGKRWVLEKGEITLVHDGLHRVFLLSDEACHKPKFLIALALGIPCVKFDWLYHSVAEVSFR